MLEGGPVRRDGDLEREDSEISFTLSHTRIVQLLLLVGIACGALACWPLVTFVTTPGVTWRSYAVEDFNNGRFARPHAAFNITGFHPNLDGWYLPPHTEGTLSYRIDKNPGEDLLIVLWTYMAPPRATGAVSASIDGASAVTILHDASLVGQVLGVPGVQPARSVVLTFTALNQSQEDALLIDQLAWGNATGVPPSAPPPLTASLGLGLMVGCVVAWRAHHGWRIGASVGFGLVVAVASANRIGALATHASDLLDPDAIGYRIFGERFQWWPLWGHGLFSADFGAREPFFPLVTHGFFDLLGSSDFHLRVVSTAFSVLTVGVALAASRRRLSWGGSLVVGGLLALNFNLVTESVRGLRTELEMFLLLLLYWFVDRPLATHQMRRALGTGIVGAALVLTRAFYLPVVVLTTAIAAFAKRQPFRKMVLSLLVAIAIPLIATAGQRAALYVRYGNASFDTDLSARAYANDEKFWYNRPLPHPELFQSLEEYQRTGCCEGPHITYFQYLFELHTLDEVVRDTLVGYWEVLRDIGGFCLLCQSPGSSPAGLDALSRAVDVSVRILGVSGLVLLAFGWRRNPTNLILPLMVVGGLSFSTFLYHRQLMEPVRNTIVVYPFLAIAAVWIIERALKGVRFRFAWTTRRGH